MLIEDSIIYENKKCYVCICICIQCVLSIDQSNNQSINQARNHSNCCHYETLEEL